MLPIKLLRQRNATIAVLNRRISSHDCAMVLILPDDPATPKVEPLLRAGIRAIFTYATRYTAHKALSSVCGISANMLALP